MYRYIFVDRQHLFSEGEKCGKILSQASMSKNLEKVFHAQELCTIDHNAIHSFIFVY